MGKTKAGLVGADMEAAFEVRNLSAFYGRKPPKDSGNMVLRDVNLVIPAGSAVGIIGPNGAGKSTLLRALAGIIPSEGEISCREKTPGDCLLLCADESVLSGWLCLFGEENRGDGAVRKRTARHAGPDGGTAESGGGRPAGTCGSSDHRAIRRAASACILCPGACPGNTDSAAG